MVARLPDGVPSLLYGTAWKEDATRSLVQRALGAGFRGIDTANQRKHYHEAAVGEALDAAFTSGDVSRDALFVQTKFTFRDGQDDRLPYDARAAIGEQVAQSFASSLEHLRLSSIDSYVLHGPSQRYGLADEDWHAWRAMETIHERAGTRFLGVSNVDAAQLDELCRGARVPPAFVQNRCYASRRWDDAVRTVASRHGVVYQGFSLLTANGTALEDRRVNALARRHDRTVPQLVFRFAKELGMLPLTGTTSVRHMGDDLATDDFALAPEDRALLLTIAE